MNKKIGIIGGGQLGRMICFAAHKLGFETVVLSDHKDAPATKVTNRSIIANYYDEEAIREFAKSVDIATLEFENIPLDTANLIAKHTALFPKPEVLKITQNRLLEKDFLHQHQIRTTKYKAIETFVDLKKFTAEFGKSILKTATMGYDGKGQFVIDEKSSLEEIWKIAKDKPLILEKFCPFESEISVMIARNSRQEMAIYEPLTNIHKNGILDLSIYPAKIDTNLAAQAQKIAKKIAKAIELVGILAIEFFVVRDESGNMELMVNELAPRPHNSGHFSMDASLTSQFEQLIRAINNLPFGSTRFHSSGRMQNLIGPEIENLQPFYDNPNAKIHLYGKSEVKEGRKMGHVNIINI